MTRPAISYAQLTDALLCTSSGGGDQPQPWFCRDTGKVHYHSDLGGEEEELPADIDDNTRCLALPDKRQLNLGSALALRLRMTICRINTTTSATFFAIAVPTRYQDLLDRHGKLSAWYAYEARATEAALRQWCADNDLPLAG